MPLFLFKFNPESYEEQSAVVQADSLEQARIILSDELDSRVEMSKEDREKIGDNYALYYHSRDGYRNAIRHNHFGIEVKSNVVFTYGCDG